jgi:hypothetical protein
VASQVNLLGGGLASKLSVGAALARDAGSSKLVGFKAKSPDIEFLKKDRRAIKVVDAHLKLNNLVSTQQFPCPEEALSSSGFYE